MMRVKSEHGATTTRMEQVYVGGMTMKREWYDWVINKKKRL